MARRLHAILEQRGIIYSVKGKGSFISGDRKVYSAVICEAKKQFEKAVESAVALGLTYEDLKEIIDQKGGKP